MAKIKAIRAKARPPRLPKLKSAPKLIDELMRQNAALDARRELQARRKAHEAAKWGVSHSALGAPATTGSLFL